MIVNSPSVFRLTGPACPHRHIQAAEAIGIDVTGIDKKDAGDFLANKIIEMMTSTGIPNGLKGVAYTEDDIENLTNSAFPQKRLIDNAPMPISREQLRGLFQRALSYW